MLRKSWFVVRWPLIMCLVVYGLSFIPLARDFMIFAASPIVTKARKGGEKIISTVEIIRSIPRLAKENGELQAQVNELTSLAVKNMELAHENELLRKELSLAPQSADNLIAAQIISRSSSASQQSILVNKGKEEGFIEGMAVVAQGYLVGRVNEVTTHSARVTLLTSVQSLLPVVLQNSRAVGLLKGGAEGLVVDEVPRDITVAPDESIVSANIGDVIQSGIPIGKVTTVLSEKSDVFQSVRISSPVDFSRLEVVFGVKKK